MKYQHFEHGEIICALVWFGFLFISFKTEFTKNRFFFHLIDIRLHGLHKDAQENSRDYGCPDHNNCRLMFSLKNRYICACDSHSVVHLTEARTLLTALAVRKVTVLVFHLLDMSLVLY